MANQDDSSGAFFLGFVVGSIAGAAYGLLNAAQSGEETRMQIRERLLGLKTRSEEFTAQTRERATETAHKMQEEAQSQLHRLEDQAQATLEQTQWRVQQTIDRLESTE